MKRSKKYKAVKTKLDNTKSYSADEILQIIKDNSLTKFPGSVEVEVQLELNQKQKSDSFRGSLSFPHNFGKEVPKYWPLLILLILKPQNLQI
jgi:large subunit ribosomal protein L1